MAINWLDIAKGGFLRGYRTPTLGAASFLSAVAAWAVGDAQLGHLLTLLSQGLAGLAFGTLHSAVKRAAPVGMGGIAATVGTEIAVSIATQALAGAKKSLISQGWPVDSFEPEQLLKQMMAEGHFSAGDAAAKGEP